MRKPTAISSVFVTYAQNDTATPANALRDAPPARIPQRVVELVWVLG